MQPIKCERNSKEAPHLFQKSHVHSGEWNEWDISSPHSGTLTASKWFFSDEGRYYINHSDSGNRANLDGSD